MLCVYVFAKKILVKHHLDKRKIFLISLHGQPGASQCVFQNEGQKCFVSNLLSDIVCFQSSDLNVKMEDIFHHIRKGDAIQVRMWLDDTEHDMNQG